MGEKQNRLFQLSLNASLKVGLKGSRVSSEDLLGQQGLRRWNECGKVASRALGDIFSGGWASKTENPTMKSMAS